MRRALLSAWVAGLALVVSDRAATAQTFTYFGDRGPEFWGTLDPAWAACGTGSEQSPIDFRRDKSSRRLPIEYHETRGAIFNNGYTIEVETEGDNVLRLGDDDYEFVQFHFHTPSEHRVLGRGYDMELHLVHRSAAGALAVVGVFLRRGPSSGALGPIFDQLPADVDVHHELEEPFNPAAFLPRSRVHYRLMGSLTTPPCSEGVRWIVLADPVSISDEHMARFNDIVRFNARPVQRRRH